MPAIGDIDVLEEWFDAWLARLAEFKRAAVRRAPEVIDRFSTESLGQLYAQCWERAMERKRLESAA